MEIKTYAAGFAKGWRGALEVLDKLVAEDLGTNVKIHEIQDTLYRRNDLSYAAGLDFDDTLARRVLYEKLKQ